MAAGMRRALDSIRMRRHRGAIRRDGWGALGQRAGDVSRLRARPTGCPPSAPERGRPEGGEKSGCRGPFPGCRGAARGELSTSRPGGRRRREHLEGGAQVDPAVLGAGRREREEQPDQPFRHCSLMIAPGAQAGLQPCGACPLCGGNPGFALPWRRTEHGSYSPIMTIRMRHCWL